MLIKNSVQNTLTTRMGYYKRVTKHFVTGRPINMFFVSEFQHVMLDNTSATHNTHALMHGNLPIIHTGYKRSHSGFHAKTNVN